MSQTRDSGGLRETRIRNIERAARRHPDFEERWITDYDNRVGAPPLGNPDRAFGWLTNVLLYAADQTIRDPGMPVEQRIQRLTAIAPQIVKAADPARVAARLEAVETALTRVRENAARQPSRETEASGSGASLC